MKILVAISQEKDPAKPDPQFLERVAQMKRMPLEKVHELWDKAHAVITKSKGANNPGSFAFTMQVFKNFVGI